MANLGYKECPCDRRLIEILLSKKISRAPQCLKKGYKIAIVALARKLLTIIHHLLTHQEFFEEEGKPTEHVSPGSAV
ncbi:MAG: hypothetical protein PWP08_329 [Methanofollis sp.]|nr:hypothetical protein [Methanofollis sp.]